MLTLIFHFVNVKYKIDADFFGYLIFVGMDMGLFKLAEKILEKSNII